MAKYLLLRFEDEEKLELAIQETELPSGAEMYAIYKAPTQYCECRSIKGRGWGKGHKWGWWVCSQCGKPSGGVSIKNRQKESSFGFNLIDPEYIERQKNEQN